MGERLLLLLLLRLLLLLLLLPLRGRWVHGRLVSMGAPVVALACCTDNSQTLHRSLSSAQCYTAAMSCHLPSMKLPLQDGAALA